MLTIGCSQPLLSSLSPVGVLTPVLYLMAQGVVGSTESERIKVASAPAGVTATAAKLDVLLQ